MQISSNHYSTTVNNKDNSKVDTSEYDFWKDPTKGLSFLDDKANTLLNDLLSGKTDEEIFLTKVTMMINIANPVTADKEGNVIRGNNSNFDISSDAVKTRLKDYHNHLEDALKGGGVDTLNLRDISKQLFELYSKSDATEESQFPEKTKTKNLEQFFEKEIRIQSEKTKNSLEYTEKTSEPTKAGLKDALKHSI